jgi:hypothetical protein
MKGLLKTSSLLDWIPSIAMVALLFYAMQASAESDAPQAAPPIAAAHH